MIKVKALIFKGVSILILAAFIWGIGNTITGVTAHKYLAFSSPLPAMDIALANTLGGLSFLLVLFFTRTTVISVRALKTEVRSSLSSLGFFTNKYSVFAGIMKGLNTSLFVFSTVFVAATQSLIFESTYILWSLILGIVFLTVRIQLASVIGKTLLLFASVVLISGQTSLHFASDSFLYGVNFGIFAGISYALYLFFWSYVTKNLKTSLSQLVSTIALLTVSLITILVMGEVMCTVFLNQLWVPFTSIEYSDVALQFINGVFVIGIVYLLVTIGMSNLETAQAGANYIAAICLSFSIIFTLMAEVIIGKFLPTALQLSGILIFMIIFISINKNISKTSFNSLEQNSREGY